VKNSTRRKQPLIQMGEGEKFGAKRRGGPKEERLSRGGGWFPQAGNGHRGEKRPKMKKSWKKSTSKKVREGGLNQQKKHKGEGGRRATRSNAIIFSRAKRREPGKVLSKGTLQKKKM